MCGVHGVRRTSLNGGFRLPCAEPDAGFFIRLHHAAPFAMSNVHETDFGGGPLFDLLERGPERLARILAIAAGMLMLFSVFL